ncbi:DNA cytosine methyltransferase, partial [Staphylococcus epidermidis]
RYDSTKPSVTITGDMRKVFHYSQNRALTSRELARLQSFPDDFIFVGSSISVQQQIGNAVPPNLAYEVAKMVRQSLEHENE